jgi:hypothetical protein
VGVAAKILEDLLWAAKGALGVNHPLGLSCQGQIAGRGSANRQWFKAIEEA